MSDVSTFISFDPEHDRELYDLIHEQAQTASSGFSIVGGSERSTAESLCSDKTSGQIRRADQVIVLCGEHSETSSNMSAELRIAQNEEKPCIFLWGRRDIMCTKPAGAKSSQGMYSWTLQNLRDQMDITMRSAKWKSPTDEFKSAAKTKAVVGDAPAK